MLIGLTYDLRSEYLAMGYGEVETAEFDRDDTIAAIEGALNDLGHDTDRIGHGRRLVQRLADGDRWDLVFNIADGMITEFRQPVIVEPYLPGREFTVGLVGTGPEAQVLGTIEVVLLDAAEAGVYSYVNKERCEELVVYRLARPEGDGQVREAERVALAAWRALGCRDGGRVDIRCDDGGRPLFMEVNPLAGLHPVHSDLPIICNHLGMPFRDLIGRILASAMDRMPMAGVAEGRRVRLCA